MTPLARKVTPAVNRDMSGGAVAKGWGSLKPYLVAVAVSFGIMGVVVGALGYSVPRAFQTLLLKPFGSRLGLTETLNKFVPITLAAYAFAIPFRIRFFNIGAWGQMSVGAATATIVGLALARLDMPPVILIPFLLAIAILSGAVFALIAGALEAYCNINPIISTIMLNYVAIHFVNFVTTTEPWNAPLAGHPMTKELPQAARLPEVFPGLHGGIVLVALVIVAAYFIMNRTVLGYEIKATGFSLDAAKVYGVNVERTLMVTFILGGALAGLAGGIEVLGVHMRLLEGFTLTSGAHFGLFGILTALICGGEPLGVPVSALFISALLVGADAMQRTMQVPVEMVFLAQGLIVLLLVILRRRAGSVVGQ